MLVCDRCGLEPSTRAFETEYIQEIPLISRSGGIKDHIRDVHLCRKCRTELNDIIEQFMPNRKKKLKNPATRRWRLRKIMPQVSYIGSDFMGMGT